MDTSSLNNSTVHRDRLYYDRYEYMVRFYMPEVSALRHTLDPAVIQWRLDNRRRLRDQLLLESVFVLSLTPINDNVTRDLLEFAGRLRPVTVDYRLMVSGNHGYIYTSDTDLIQEIKTMSYLTLTKLSRAVIARPRDAIQLRNPQHHLRTYFRSVEMTEDSKDHLRKFLHAQPPGDIRLSPGLAKWFHDYYIRTENYYFVDHNDTALLTMIGLIFSGLTRKTVPIIAADK